MHCCIDFLWMTQFNWELSCITSPHKFSIISKKCNQSYFFECTEAEMKANKFISKFPMNSEWRHPNDMQQSLKWVSAKSRVCLFNRKHECKHFVREMQCDIEKKNFSIYFETNLELHGDDEWVNFIIPASDLS